MFSKRWLTAVVLILVAEHVTLLEMGNATADSRERPVTLKVLTLNAWAIRGTSDGARTTAQRLAELCRRVRRMGPDVVFLQEVWRYGNFAQIRDACRFPYHARSDRYRSDFQLEVGLVILSRFPLDRVQLRIFPKDDPRRKTRKGALLARAKLPDGRYLWLANTHLCSNDAAVLGQERNPRGERMFLGGPAHDPNEVTRQDQLRQLTRWLDRHTAGPVLLGGDLNTGPQYPLWWRFLRELPRRHPALGATLSFTRDLPCTYCNQYAARGYSEGQLDHLLGFRGAQIQRSEVTLKETFQATSRARLHENVLGLFSRRYRHRARAFQSAVSDHYGVISEIQVKR